MTYELCIPALSQDVYIIPNTAFNYSKGSSAITNKIAALIPLTAFVQTPVTLCT